VDCSELLKRLHVWGNPTYVLDPTIQDGKKLPKWKPRARRGMFLGYKSKNSSTVGMIMNLNTGYVSPQYHVVYDDLFSTVTTTGSQQDIVHGRDFDPAQWEMLISTC
jgi:hypothetical protein